MKWLNIITLLLLIVGGVNWGLVALGGHEMDLVANLFGGDDATMARLESLTGPEFDKLWLESMVGQHQGGVAIANDEIADGANVDAVSIARTIVAGLDPQIAQMKKMLEGMP